MRRLRLQSFSLKGIDTLTFDAETLTVHGRIKYSKTWVGSPLNHGDDPFPNDYSGPPIITIFHGATTIIIIDPPVIMMVIHAILIKIIHRHYSYVMCINEFIVTVINEYH